MIKKDLKNTIGDFLKGTGLFQVLLIIGLIVLIGYDLGFNQKLRLWLFEQFLLISERLLYQILYDQALLFIEPDDDVFLLALAERLARIYFYVILVLSVIIVVGIFILIPVIKYYWKNRCTIFNRTKKLQEKTGNASVPVTKVL